MLRAQCCCLHLRHTRFNLLESYYRNGTVARSFHSGTCFPNISFWGFVFAVSIWMKGQSFKKVCQFHTFLLPWGHSLTWALTPEYNLTRDLAAEEMYFFWFRFFCLHFLLCTGWLPCGRAARSSRFRVASSCKRECWRPEFRSKHPHQSG